MNAKLTALENSLNKCIRKENQIQKNLHAVKDIYKEAAGAVQFQQQASLKGTDVAPQNTFSEKARSIAKNATFIIDKHSVKNEDYVDLRSHIIGANDKEKRLWLRGGELPNLDS